MDHTGHEQLFWRLETRLDHIKYQCDMIKDMNALTPEDSDSIDKELFKISKNADEAEIYAANVYQKMVGD